MTAFGANDTYRLLTGRPGWCLALAVTLGLTTACESTQQRRAGDNAVTSSADSAPDTLLAPTALQAARQIDTAIELADSRHARTLIGQQLRRVAPLSDTALDLHEKQVQLLLHDGNHVDAAMLSARILTHLPTSTDQRRKSFLLIQSWMAWQARQFERSARLLSEVRNLAQPAADRSGAASYGEALQLLIAGHHQKRNGNSAEAHSQWRRLLQAARTEAPGSRWADVPYRAMRELLPQRPRGPRTDPGHTYELSEQALNDLALAEQMLKAQPLASRAAIAGRLDLAAFVLSHGLDDRAAMLLNQVSLGVDRVKDPYYRALLEGRQAQFALAAGNWSKAITTARRAIFASQRYPELTYQWQWTMARALAKSAGWQQTLQAYRAAAITLDELRANGNAPVRFEQSGLLYFELTSHLLGATRNTGSNSSADTLTREALRNIEKSKESELRDYFHDDCVARFRSSVSLVDHLPGDAAALYPILLSDRIELLLLVGNQIDRVTVPVTRQRVTGTTRELRTFLTQRTTRRYIRPAQQLYDWLLAPIIGKLASHGVKTIVWLPEGPLRTVPLAVLHDGKDFVVSRYAVASTPGLNLTQEPADHTGAPSALVAGVSRAVQGFAPLRHVPGELQTVVQYTSGKQLLDAAFSTRSLVTAMRTSDYSVVHIASHARFDSDVDNTFILTYDNRVGMDQFASLVSAGQFRDRGLDLLTLSACETAAGDDRSALGLAGAAVKSGARSVLASLWPIDDQASALLLSAFYRHYYDTMSPAGKAIALQQAQKALLADRRYRHPAYWSAFLMIGDWQ